MSIIQHIEPGNRAVSRTVAYALTINDSDGYAALSHVAAMRLDRASRVGLAWAFTKSLDAEDADQLFDCNGAGMPVAPFIDVADEANFWVEVAEPGELRAYGLACFRGMSPREKEDFLRRVSCEVSS